MKLMQLISLVLLGGCMVAPCIVSPGQQYVGMKYISDPLGEGVAPDADPLIRYDAFDCTTFVETVLANGDVHKLNKIRYKDGNVGFLSRNHFIETDWLPNNSGIVENVSHKFGKTEIRHVVIDKKNWFKTVHGLDTNVETAVANLEYIPYDNLGTINIPEPMIVLFITGNLQKYDKIGTDIAVVHMGFVLPDGVLRHASSSHGRVMDTDFTKYVQLRRQMKNNIGIALVKIK